MKKIIATALGLALVGGVAVTTASAVESQFGGYWRTRMYFQDNFFQSSPNFDSAQNATDTRTRLYYTAKFNDNFKFVNKFEFNTMWGDNNGGDIGADGKGNFRIKNSYADFTLGMVNTKVGIQSATIARGFVFSDDFSGAVVTADFGMVKVPVLYAMASNEDRQGWDGSVPSTVKFVTNSVADGSLDLGNGNGDIHILSTMPQIKINDNVTITPNATWATVTEQDTDVYWIGVDADLKFDAVSGWITGIYNGGSVDKVAFGGTDDQDISAWLIAAGADAGIVHGQAFYATGDDNGTDNDTDSFVAIGVPGTAGTSYYWSEIMGYGMFDYDIPGNTMGDRITNIWAVNLGVTVKPIEKLTLNFDAWYAQHAEDVLAPNGQMEKDMGTELDAKVSYELMDNLNADVVFAYLFAGDAIGPEDVMEGGVQLSLKF